MATKRKKKTPKPRPAPWFRKFGLDEEHPDRARAYRLATLNARVKLLRPYFSGFESSDGFDLRHPESWTAAQVRTVDDYSSHVNALKASPHLEARSRTDRQRKALAKFTGQDYRGKKHVPKKFIVHHPEAEFKAKRKLRARVTEDDNVEIVRELTGIVTRMTSYLFSDYGINSARFISTDDLVAATKKMIRIYDQLEAKRVALLEEIADAPRKDKKKLREKYQALVEKTPTGMPPGWYQLETALHGPIWYAMERNDIVLNLNRFGQQYTRSPEFSKGILGFRHYKDEISAEIRANAMQEERQKKRKLSQRFGASNRMRKQMTRWRARADYKAPKKKPAQKKRKPAKRKK